MRERIESLIPNSASRTQITTFHSFCADLLRQHGHHIGLRPDFTILAQDIDRELVLEEAIQNCQAEDDYKAAQLLPMITRLLDQNIPLDDAEDVLFTERRRDSKRLAKIYTAYRTRLIDNNRLDFGALVAEAIILLESQPGICKQIHRIYPYVCVDEFQDTNLSQYRVLRQLVAPKTRNLFVVADDDQIIYQWNGASPERLEQLRNEFKMTVIQLPENYRCPPEVVDIANLLIANNLGRSADKELLKAYKKPTNTSSVRVFPFNSLEEEARWVAADINAKPTDEQAKCAILGRTRKVLNVFLQNLEEVGLSGYFNIRKNEFESHPVQWLHSMLRLTNSRQDKEQLRRVCKVFYALEGINLDVRDVVSMASSEEGDYLRAWQAAVLNRAGLEEQTRELVKNTVTALSDRLDFRLFISASFHWFDTIEIFGSEAEAYNEEFLNEKNVWQELTYEIDSQYGSENVTLHQFLQELDLRSKAPAPPEGAIPCFTIHASKGMEFGQVYLAALVEDQLPSWASLKKGDNSQEMQEERRNCFVAVTRAQESLTLTYAKQVFGWNKEPSRFLREMGLI